MHEKGQEEEEEEEEEEERKCINVPRLKKREEWKEESGGRVKEGGGVRPLLPLPPPLSPSHGRLLNKFATTTTTCGELLFPTVAVGGRTGNITRNRTRNIGRGRGMIVLLQKLGA